MKKVKWLSGDRVIPTVGQVETNSIIDLSDSLADRYIGQGEAEEVKQVKREKTREGDDK